MIGVKVDEERKPEEDKKKKNVIAMVAKLMEKGDEEASDIEKLVATYEASIKMLQPVQCVQEQQPSSSIG